MRNLLQRQATFEKSLHRVQEAYDEKFFLVGTEIADTQKSVEALRDVIDARLNATGEAIRQLDSPLHEYLASIRNYCRKSSHLHVLLGPCLYPLEILSCFICVI